MKMIPKATPALVLALLLPAASACTTGGPTNTAQPSAPSNANANASPTPSATPTPTPASASNAASLPVTLPVLDAMFADEAFAGELKSKLQLSDEQVARLRQVAREGTAELSEQGAEMGTTKEATQRAAEKIREVVGEEKASAFTALVRERWAGGEAALPSKPNAVPTDTRVVVNAPAYRMDVFQDGRLTKTYRVGIGY